MTHVGGTGRESLPRGKTAHCHLKGPQGQEWGGGVGRPLLAGGLVGHSQRLVGAVLGLEEAHHEEGHRLQAQHQHHASDEAGPVKAGVVGFRDRRTPCRGEVIAGHQGPGPQAYPVTHTWRPQSSLWGPEQQALSRILWAVGWGWGGQGLGCSPGSAPELLCVWMLFTPSLPPRHTDQMATELPSRLPSTPAQEDEDGPRTQTSRSLLTLDLGAQSPGTDDMVPFQDF